MWDMYGGGDNAEVHDRGERPHGVGHGIGQVRQGSHQDPQLMEVQIKVLSQVQKQFLGRRASLWAKLGNARPVKK